jgi:hypothetical protein
MFATVRRYVMPPSAVGALAERAGDIQSVLADVPGCTGGQFIRTNDGLIVVLIGEDEPVLVEAGRRFVAWSRRHVPAFDSAPLPDVWAGDLVGSSLDGGSAK